MPRCAFCDKQATMTGEHIWSVWMKRSRDWGKGKLKRIDPTSEAEFILNKSPFDLKAKIVCEPCNNGWMAEFILNKSPFDLKAKIVCEPCNNGWMSDLENKEAKPVLGPLILSTTPQSLLPRSLQSIAAFAFKTAVILDHMNPARQSSFFTPDVRRAFAANLKIPPLVQMWIAEFRTSVSANNLVITDYRKGSRAPASAYEVYVLTYAIGHVAFQVASLRRIGVGKGPFAIPVLRQSRDFERFAYPYWPLTGSSLAWPPTHFLDESLIKKFCYRWRSIEFID